MGGPQGPRGSASGRRAGVCGSGLLVWDIVSLTTILMLIRMKHWVTHNVSVASIVPVVHFTLLTPLLQFGDRPCFSI